MYVFVSEDSKELMADIADGHRKAAAILAQYVDYEVLMGGDDASHAQGDVISTCFNIKDLGDASQVFGTNTSRDLNRGTVSVAQASYVRNILKKFGMEGCNEVKSPGVGVEFSVQ